MDKKAVVIISGGMDSTTLLYDVVAELGKDNVQAISFNYNQKHKCELEKAKKTCEKLGVNHRVLSLAVLNEVAPSALTRDDWKIPEGHYSDENMKQTVVPNRNMVMLSLAAAFAMGVKAQELYYGAHAGDHTIYPDCRKEFIDSMVQSIKLADWNEVELKAPYWQIDKVGILKIGKELGVDYSLTHTCYNPNKEGKSCGRCGSCTERLEAFEKNGIKDPLEYYDAI
jgi:7-cyano-7-deazaguanine synthase